MKWQIFAPKSISRTAIDLPCKLYTD